MAPHFRLIAFEASHVLDFAGDDAVPEMHDRIIAGLARRLQAPLLTSDARIINAGVAEVVW
jgi:predicted nucleic acid-binding protein